MTNGIHITCLDGSFVISDHSQDNLLAGLTNGEDLVDYIAKWAGVDEVIEEPVGFIGGFIDNEKIRSVIAKTGESIMKAHLKKSGESDVSAEVPEHTVDSNARADVKPVIVKSQVLVDAMAEVKKEVASKAKGDDRDPIFDLEKLDAKQEEQTSSSRALKFVAYLDSQGASKYWVKATLTDISGHLDVSAPVASATIDRAKEMFPRLRVCKVAAGVYRGNNFTFNQDLAEPGKEVKPAAKPKKKTPPVAVGKSDPESTSCAERIMAGFEASALKIRQNKMRASYARLAERHDVSIKDVRQYLEELVLDGQIVTTRVKGDAGCVDVELL